MRIADHVFAWAMFLVAVGLICLIGLRHPYGAFLDTPRLGCGGDVELSPTPEWLREGIWLAYVLYRGQSQSVHARGSRLQFVCIADVRQSGMAMGLAYHLRSPTLVGCLRKSSHGFLGRVPVFHNRDQPVAPTYSHVRRPRCGRPV